MDKQVNDAMVWMNSKMNQQNSQDLTLEPVVKVGEIKAKTKVLRVHSAPHTPLQSLKASCSFAVAAKMCEIIMSSLYRLVLEIHVILILITLIE